jgi:signal transduction histidine kinase
MLVNDADPEVIVIDDNPDHLNLLAAALSRGDGRSTVKLATPIHTYTDPAEALAALPADKTTVILCDYNMPSGTGLHWLADLLRPNCGPVILLTAEGDEHVAAQSLKMGAADYLIKDDVITNPDVLFQSIREALRRHKLERRNRDLSQQLKLANRDLERKNVKLGELTETAHRFVDDVAHEFRTPLTVIKEFAGIIADGLGGPVSDEQTEYLQYIDSATRELAQMVDDFLDTSRIKAGSLRVDRREHDVAELFDAIDPMVRGRAKAKSVQVEQAVEPDLGQVFCDLDKAVRALVNLSVNAVKFSPQGGRVRLWARQSDHGDVLIGVSDQGPGIAPQDLKVIGDRFRQVGVSQPGAIKGFGLGLNIARDLICLNLGDMRVQSELGKGSTFAFTLPGCMPDRVLRCYIDTIVERQKQDSLTLLQVTASSEGDEAESLRQFFASASYPLDLVIKAIGEPMILLLGATNEPDNWISRLKMAWDASAEAGGRSASPSFDIRWIGTWERREIEDQMLPRVLNRLMGVAACA